MISLEIHCLIITVNTLYFIPFLKIYVLDPSKEVLTFKLGHSFHFVLVRNCSCTEKCLELMLIQFILVPKLVANNVFAINRILFLDFHFIINPG